MCHWTSLIPSPQVDGEGAAAEDDDGWLGAEDKDDDVLEWSNRPSGV